MACSPAPRSGPGHERRGAVGHRSIDRMMAPPYSNIAYAHGPPGPGPANPRWRCSLRVPAAGGWVCCWHWQAEWTNCGMVNPARNRRLSLASTNARKGSSIGACCGNDAAEAEATATAAAAAWGRESGLVFVPPGGRRHVSRDGICGTSRGGAARDRRWHCKGQWLLRTDRWRRC